LKRRGAGIFDEWAGFAAQQRRFLGVPFVV
jgi:hypothetical protein